MINGDKACPGRTPRTKHESVRVSEWVNVCVHACNTGQPDRVPLRCSPSKSHTHKPAWSRLACMNHVCSDTLAACCDYTQAIWPPPRAQHTAQSHEEPFPQSCYWLNSVRRRFPELLGNYRIIYVWFFLSILYFLTDRQKYRRGRVG